MPRNRISTDADHVVQDPKPSKKPKDPPPKPWPLPKFKPMHIKTPFTDGRSNLQNVDFAIDTESPLAVFSLFFTDEILQILCDHTNQNAKKATNKGPRARPWQDTSAVELKAYLAGYIWIGLYPMPSVDSYWSIDSTSTPDHGPFTSRISRNRWQQIDRYFHISKPPISRETPFEKLEPLDTHLRKMFKKFWTPGTHLAVDESIQRFLGRSEQTVNIPSKPVPEGFKIWLLGNSGYVLDWMHHEKGDDKGPVDLEDFWTKWKGLSKTEAVVMDLVTQEGVNSDNKHIIWLDNLFTSTLLLKILKEEGFGAAGTVRTTKTKREITEEEFGTNEQQERQRREPNRGLDPSLSDLKLDHNAQLEWGKLFGRVSKDKEVLQFAWKDQNVVLFMSTVTTGRKKVIRCRKRPAKTATNSRTSRAVFGDDIVKELEIPEFIDMYNRYMNSIDVADQLRSYYNTQRTHRKNWKSLWHFLLDTTITNSYLIAKHTPERPWVYGQKQSGHYEFRKKLALQLFEQSERLSKIRTPMRSLQSKMRHTSRVKHGEQPIKIGGFKNCDVCLYKKNKQTKQRPKRAGLSELALTSVRVNGGQRQRANQYPRTLYGCKECRIHICRNSSCFVDHLDLLL